ncbi:MAG: response regulator [Burkholderiaceae bacterium]
MTALPRRVLVYRVLMVLLAGLYAWSWWFAERVNTQRTLTQARAEVQRSLNEVRDKLGASVYSDIQLATGLVGVINLVPDLDQARFERAARPLLVGHGHLQAVAAAPDLVIRLMVPLQGNEKAIGVDYRGLPGQFAAVDKARQTRQVVLAGPLTLVQGGTALVARLPVYLHEGGPDERFWGIVSAVSDADRLFKGSGLADPQLPIEVAIRGRDGSGPSGEVFFGPAALFSAAPVLAEIQLPSGSWQLAAVSRGGWPAGGSQAMPLRLGFLSVGLLLFGALLALGRALDEAHAAHRQADAYGRQVATLIESAPDAIVVVGADQRVALVNGQAEQLFGARRDTLVGQPVDRLLADEAEPAAGRTREARGRRQDGSEFPIEVSLSSLQTEQGRLVLRSIRDVSARQAAQAELERYRVHLEGLVSERTSELAMAKEAAESASVAKSAFLANMSHEIRTPLNAITGMAHLVRRSGVSSEQAARLDQLEAAGKHLLEVINAILDLSKIEAGKVELARVDVRLDSLVQNVAMMIHDRLREKGLALSLDVPAEPGALLGDPTRLQQGLLNYASNAAKFTEHGQVAIRVRIAEEDERGVLVRFEVEDTGVGIAADKLALLFSPFEQADNTATREHGGTGLGLVITQRMAQLMGGDAGALSTPGTGSLFWFTARLQRGSAGQAAPRPPRQSQEAAETALQRRHRGRRVLVVEDEPVNGLIARALLEDAGLQVTEARDGEEAVALADAQAFDLVLMDMQMPRMGGLAAARRMRQLARHRYTPIVAMTANAFDEDRAECLAAGMDDFIAKPFEPAQLYETALRWLSQAVAARGAAPVNPGSG